MKSNTNVIIKSVSPFSNKSFLNKFVFILWNYNNFAIYDWKKTSTGMNENINDKECKVCFSFFFKERLLNIKIPNESFSILK